MRWVALVVVVASCHTYDPLDALPHREFADTRQAIEAILAEVPQVKVYAVGEYHMTSKSVARSSPLARFTNEILAMLEPRAHHLVVESWLDDGCRSSAKKQIAQAIDRPNSQTKQLEALFVKTRRLRLEAHDLPITCIEHDSLLDAGGHVDFLQLLEMVTDKLGDETREMLHEDPDHPVIVYGGALHNDLYPRWPLEDLSYAVSLQRELGGGVLELDLIVPEVVQDVALARSEPWAPLLNRAAPDRVVVWERGPSSYVVILPTQPTVASPIASM
jgi:hypothetical protein